MEPKSRQPIFLINLCKSMKEVPKQTIVLGTTNSSAPLMLSLSMPGVSHMLVAGTASEGTSLMHSMILSLAMHNRLGEVQMIFVGLKDTRFDPFITCGQSGRKLPHLLKPVARNIHETIFLLGEMVEEMIRRDRENVSEPRVVIFIDEVADLMEQGGKAADRLMARLMQRGASVGLHIIACAQNPSGIGNLAIDNFSMRFVGRVVSANDAEIAAGIPSTGAEKLSGHGDFVLVIKGGITHFQAAYVSEEEIWQVVNRMSGGKRNSRRWLTEFA